MFGIMVHEKPTVQRNIVVWNFVIAATGLHLSFPPDPICNCPARKVFMSTSYGNKRKMTPQFIKFWVFFVPFPPFCFQIIQGDPP